MRRAAPFAVVAVLAEASLALPPGPRSWPAVVTSLVLLGAAAGAFLLPWTRLPAWLTVLVPLAHVGSVLALILATGADAGVAIVLLIPMIWTALFHRPWESACVVAAVVAVQLTISLTPVLVLDSVIARRVLLWGLVGVLISVAVHGLRHRVTMARAQAEELHARLREMSVLQDRDRIAASLQDTVIQRLFAAGISLQSASSIALDDEVRHRIDASVGDLDEVLKILRDTIFGLEHRLRGRGLREEIADLCGALTPVPEISFSGPVDGALHPGAREQLIEILGEALSVIGQRVAAPARVRVAAGADRFVTVIEAGPVPGTVAADWPRGAFDGLADRAARAGVRFDIEPTTAGAKFALHAPLGEPDELPQARTLS